MPPGPEMTDPPEFVCGICGASFGTSEAYEHHLTTAHPVQKHVDKAAAALDAAIKNLANQYDPKGIVSDMAPDSAMVKGIIALLSKPFTRPLPLVAPYTPTEVYTHKEKAAWKTEDEYSRWIEGAGILGAVPFLNLDRPMYKQLDRPVNVAEVNRAIQIFGSEYDYGQKPYMQRYWQQKYQPFLPGYADMIGVYMREGYLAEKWVEIPYEFVRYMLELGFSEFWAYRLWGKHWVLPGVDHLYEMFHKKIIDADTMSQMLRYHDFEPVWRARLIDNAYTMVPRVDLRRAYVWGLLREEQLQERYEWLGYRPADAILMKDIAKRFGLSAYYSRLLTVASASFRKGQLSGGELQAVMERCGLPLEAQNLIFAAEKMARDAAVTEPGEEPRVLTVSQILSAYSKQFLSLSAAKTRILALGYLEGDADLLLQLATPKPPAEAPATEIVSAASLLYRQGWMSSEEFTTWLRKAGLSPEEIAVQKDAQDLRYWLDYATDLLALWKQMYAKDLITLDEFYTNLLRWGCQPDRAWAIVSLEETRKIPKPKAAG